MDKFKLQIEQLGKRMSPYIPLRNAPEPPNGWVKIVRTSLGMSLEQLGKKLGITRQSVRHLEQREAKGSITLKTLSDAAEAMDMKLVYGFVPQDDSLDQLIERKARELATELVMRTSRNMKLEDQENSKERIEKAIEQMMFKLINETPRSLWD